MLQLTNIKKSFHKKNDVVNVIDNFSLTVDEGEFIAVQGASGSGKTTLLLMIGTLLTPDNGTVLINGTDPYTLNPEVRANFRARNIGFVFQQFYLLPYLTVLENVLTSNLVVKKANAKEKALNLLKHLNLEHRLTHLPSELSVGERQRTALARAVLNRSKLILADEPTGNLDAENSAVILDYLKNYAAKGNYVLMVTHSKHAAETTDRIEVIENQVSGVGCQVSDKSPFSKGGKGD